MEMFRESLCCLWTVDLCVPDLSTADTKPLGAGSQEPVSLYPPCTLDISCATLGKLLTVHCVLKMGTCRPYQWHVVRTKRPC